MRSSTFLAAFAAAALFACLATASAVAAPLVWTLNSSKASVSTIDSESGEVVGSSIPVGEAPDSIAITPNGERAVVVSASGEDVTILDTETRTPVATIPLPGDGESVAIAPGGRTAYVTDEGDEEVRVIDVETATEAGSFKVGPQASALAFAPEGARAFVGTAAGVAVVNTATQKVVAGPIDVGGPPTSIVVAPNGNTAYVTAEGVEQVEVLGTAPAAVLDTIPLASEPTNLAVAPNGRKLYILSAPGETLSVAETATDATPAGAIAVPGEPSEVVLDPSGATAYVAAPGSEQLTRIDTASRTATAPIPLPGDGVAHLVVAPDQSPTAAFTAPSPIATFPASFNGSASTDPDGRVASWEWSFGEGGVGRGQVVTHTYGRPGTYETKLTVTDDEGCGEAEVFTGRTAYCGGGPSAVVHPVTVTAAPTLCTARFHIGRLIHNRRNGTVRLQVKLPTTGFLLLFGKKVHAVTRKVRKAGPMWLTVHARVELNKRLKKTHRASVRTRLTFTPTANCGWKTVHRSFALLRAHRKKHRGSR